MTRAHGRKVTPQPTKAFETGKSARRAGLTLERTLNYFAHDAGRLPPAKIEEGWNAQDAEYTGERK